ncbi:MAG: heme lyase CcmF/NrfE family subunit [Deltaproteobacteria bacterium]|nr:heme lyase CcmF/NrfE family subunit [Deltaproteobacteria bacterium]
MAEFGHYSLCVSWILALIGMVSGVLAGRKPSRAWLETASNATILVCVSSFLALAALAFGFLSNDYTNQYVWQTSNRDMSPLYKITAIWGGMDGSMLLWATFLSVSAMCVALRGDKYGRTLLPWTLAVLNSSCAFFLTLVVFFTNPFRYVKAGFIPPDGNGMNPLLQNPYMAIHPPTLYLGFTILAVPFAFCMAALLSGSLSNEWIRLTRRWTLIGWCFLTAGIVLGGHWAYIELGWGGFWAWDPVENASFLPWLTASAFLHSVMVQERKNMLRIWNIWLVTLTYALTVFGTFLTRSGVVQSVHSFASSDIGPAFLIYLAILLAFTAFMCFYRRADLKSERGIESFLSREAAFLVNNLIFLSICFATLWGVMFPVLSEGLTGVKQAVGIPFFNTVNIPLFLCLLFMMGVGPLIAWRKASFSSLVRTFSVPFLCAFLAGVLLVWAGVLSFYPVLTYCICVFVLMTIMGEFHRGLKVQRAAAPSQGTVTGVATLFRRHRTRYGSHIVHFGVLVVTIGITASMAHKVEKEFTLAKGETYQEGRFSLTLNEFSEVEERNFTALRGVVQLRAIKNDELLGTLKPELRLYKRNKETTTEVALRMGLREDVYLVLAGLDDSGERAAFKLFINPLQVWLWFGTVIMILGTVIVMIPVGLREKSAVPSGEIERSKA